MSHQLYNHTILCHSLTGIYLRLCELRAVSTAAYAASAIPQTVTQQPVTRPPVPLSLPPQKRTRLLDPDDIAELITNSRNHFPDQQVMAQLELRSGDEIQFSLCSSFKHLSISDRKESKISVCDENSMAPANAATSVDTHDLEKQQYDAVRGHNLALACCTTLFDTTRTPHDKHNFSRKLQRRRGCNRHQQPQQSNLPTGKKKQLLAP